MASSLGKSFSDSERFSYTRKGFTDSERFSYTLCWEKTLLINGWALLSFRTCICPPLDSSLCLWPDVTVKSEGTATTPLEDIKYKPIVQLQEYYPCTSLKGTDKIPCLVAGLLMSNSLALEFLYQNHKESRECILGHPNLQTFILPNLPFLSKQKLGKGPKKAYSDRFRF